MGLLSAADSWRDSSNLKVLLGSRAGRPVMNHFPPTSVLQLSSGEDQRPPSEGGWQLLAVATGPGLREPYRGFVLEGLTGVSWMPSHGGVAKQFSP